MTLISGIPPWLIMYFEKLTEKSGKKLNKYSQTFSLLLPAGSIMSLIGKR